MISSAFDASTSALVVRFDVDILSSNTEELGHTLKRVLETQPDHKSLEVDLRGCRMVDSVGLNLLFSLMSKYKDRGLAAKIVISKGPLDRIMRVANVGSLFTLEVR